MPRISFSGTTVIHEVAENSVIYDALSDQGVELPHGCLSGSCGACRINVVEGSRNLAPPGLIEANTVESIREEYVRTHGAEFLSDKSIRLACRAKVTGDVVIDPLARKK
jgi:ferredoxin